MKRTVAAACFLTLLAVEVSAADAPAADWPPARQREILDKTLTLRLAPDLSAPDRRRAARGRRAAGGGTASAAGLREMRGTRRPPPLASGSAKQPASDLATLYRLFQGPIATTLDNKREPFLAVDAGDPGQERLSAGRHHGRDRRLPRRPPGGARRASSTSARWCAARPPRPRPPISPRWRAIRCSTALHPGLAAAAARRSPRARREGVLRRAVLRGLRGPTMVGATGTS